MLEFRIRVFCSLLLKFSFCSEICFKSIEWQNCTLELFLQQNFKKSKLLDISSKWTKFQSEILSNSNFIIQVWVLIFIPIPENVTSKILHICCAQWCVIQFDFCQENSKRGPDVKENKASTSDYCHILCFQRLLKFTRPCKKIIVNRCLIRPRIPNKNYF